MKVDWIKASDDLPEEEKRVFVVDKDGYVFIARIAKYDGWCLDESMESAEYIVGWADIPDGDKVLAILGSK